MQVERTMSLAAVKKNRDGDNRDVGQTQRHDPVNPPREVEYAGEKHGVQKSVPLLPFAIEITRELTPLSRLARPIVLRPLFLGGIRVPPRKTTSVCFRVLVPGDGTRARDTR
jgi:hypothetical protein